MGAARWTLRMFAFSPAYVHSALISGMVQHRVRPEKAARLSGARCTPSAAPHWQIAERGWVRPPSCRSSACEVALRVAPLNPCVGPRPSREFERQLRPSGGTSVG